MNIRHLGRFEHKMAAIAVLVMLFLGSGLMPGQIGASDSAVVSIFVDGEKTSITTSAQTVGEVLDRAEIELREGDLVEPGLEREITNQIFNVNVYRARPVLIVDGEDEYQAKSAYRSARLIAENSGAVEVHEEDIVTGQVIDDFIDERHIGYKVEIERAVPVQLDMGGKKTTLRTHAATVGEMFETAGIDIGNNDIVRPSLDTRISHNLKVNLLQVGFETITEEIELQSETVTEYDNNRPMGYEEVEEAGEPGLALVTYEVEYRNGEEADRKEIRRVVEKEPKNRVVIIGNKTNYTSNENRDLGRQMAADNGWTGSQWNCLDTLWGSKESGWNNNAQNPTSTAYGIAQFLDSTWSAYGFTKSSDPVVQIEAGMAYIEQRYGSPCAALNHSDSVGWY